MTTTESTRSTPKSIDDLTIQDNYLFGTLMRDPGICKEILQRILGISIESISYPETEKTIDTGHYSKGIRLDIFTGLPDQSICCVEMQVRKTSSDRKSILPKRTRYYHSAIDTSVLEKGSDYSDLPICILIFICVFDEFALGLHRYTFRSVCAESDGLLLDDGAETIILNTRGAADDISPELLRFLDFVDGKPASEADPFLCQLEEKIQEIKSDEKWRHSYMIMCADFMDARREGRIEGREEGREEGRVLESIEIYKNEMNMDDDQIKQKLINKFSLDESTALDYLKMAAGD